jgi:hypothetical protein
MRHLTVILFLTAVSGVVLADEPAYLLEYPGIAFGWLPVEFDPPVEGSLTAESGAIASSPNTQGIEYHVHYWDEDMTADDRSDDWLDQRLRSVISPDMTPNMGDIEWTEGSMKSPEREHSSIGLVVSVNFNFLGEGGEVLATGKAYAAFVNGYSILLYGIAPTGTFPIPGQVLDEIIALAFRVG